MKLTPIPLLAGTLASAFSSTPSPVTSSRCSSAMAARRDRRRSGQQRAQPHRRQRGHRRHSRGRQALLEASPPPRLTKAEHGAPISAFNPEVRELLEQARLAGREPAVQGAASPPRRPASAPTPGL